MKMKKLAVAFLAGALTVGSAMTASAAWVQSGSEWKYQNEDNSWQAGKWFQDAGKWYHFDENGNMRKGWFKDVDGKWYFLAYHGAMQTGLIQVDNKVYFMNADGSLFVGTMKISGVEYDFTENGTTNGKPSVGRAQTWGGNGNQSSLIGGGGSSSGGGGGTTPAPTPKEEAKKEINNKINDAVKEPVHSEKAGEVKIEVKDTNIVIDVEHTDIKVSEAPEVKIAAEEMLESIFAQQNVTSIKVGNQEYSRKEYEDKGIDLENRLSNFEDISVEAFLKLLSEKGVIVELNNSDTPIKYTIK